MTHVVRCGECGTVLNEGSDAPIAEREPCPVCGSMRRGVLVNLGGAVTAVASVSGSLEVGMLSVTPAAVSPPETEQAVRAVADHLYTELRFYLPSVPGEVWYVELVESDERIALDMPRTLNEALLGVYRFLRDRWEGVSGEGER
jgi:hypothetical protein